MVDFEHFKQMRERGNEYLREAGRVHLNKELAERLEKRKAEEESPPKPSEMELKIQEQKYKEKQFVSQLRTRHRQFHSLLNWEDSMRKNGQGSPILPKEHHEIMKSKVEQIEQVIRQKEKQKRNGVLSPQLPPIGAKQPADPSQLDDLSNFYVASIKAKIALMSGPAD
jgi:hypothetical protein